MVVLLRRSNRIRLIQLYMEDFRAIHSYFDFINLKATKTKILNELTIGSSVYIFPISLRDRPCVSGINENAKSAEQKIAIAGITNVY